MNNNNNKKVDLMLIKARKGNTWRVLTTFPCASLKQRCTHPPFCLNFSRSFNIYSVSLSLTEVGHSRDPSEWQENSNGTRQGCFWKKRHMVSRWYLGDSQTRANWDRTESSRWCQALSIFIYSLVCQGGCLVSFYFLSQEVENGLNKAERLIGILALMRGFTHPKPLWWCTCLTPMPQPWLLFPGWRGSITPLFHVGDEHRWLSGGPLRCACVCSFSLWIPGGTA